MCRTETVLDAAGLTWADIQKPRARTNGKPEIVATYDYTDEQGTLLYQACRMLPKDFWQRRPDGAGGWIKKLGDVRRVVYRLHKLRGQSLVHIPEGERDADRLVALGLAATTNAGGAGNWRDDYARQLVEAGVERVVVLPDNDDPGRQHAEDVARSCTAAGLKVRIVTLPDLAPKGDVSDWIDAGHTADDLLMLLAAADTCAAPSTEPAAPSPDDVDDEDHDVDDRGGGRRSQATQLVDLVLGNDVELWHTPTSEPYITIRVGGHREHHPLGSRSIRDWLSRLHHQHTERTPGSQAIADAIGTLAGQARFDGETHEVHVRVAGHAEAVYLDLGDPTWRAIEITSAGWRLVEDPPVRFRRGRALLALPEPTGGGTLDTLRHVIHVASDDDWHLLVGWMIGAVRPCGPYPALAFDGEQGSGKSTRARMVRRMIDPSAAELRAEPREIRDLMIACAGGWIPTLDNVSHLQPWLSDALCRISTGGALSTRQLYSNDDEHIVEAVRPLIITGITSVITRGDLADRTIAITLPAIPETERRSEADLWRAYEAIRPGALGALLDAVSCALRRQHDVRLGTLPRMADWAVWVTAAEPAVPLEHGTIVAAYTAARQVQTEQAIDGDPLAVAIRGLLDAAPGHDWEGTAAELLTKLTPPGRAPRGWPESPRGLSGALRRLAPQLRRVGIEVDLGRRVGHDRRRVIGIELVGARPSAPSAPSSVPDSLLESADGSADRPPTVRQPSAGSPPVYGAQDDADDADGSTPIPTEDADAAIRL